MTGLLRFDDHIGSQLCDFIREQTAQNVSLASMSNYCALNRADQHFARCCGTQKPVTQTVQRSGRTDLHEIIFAHLLRFVKAFSCLETALLVGRLRSVWVM